MNRLKNTGLILCGLVLGLTLSSPAARAVGSLKVTLSTNGTSGCRPTASLWTVKKSV